MNRARLANGRVGAVISIVWAWVASRGLTGTAALAVLTVCVVLAVAVVLGLIAVGRREPPQHPSQGDQASLFRRPAFIAMVAAEAAGIGVWLWYAGSAGVGQGTTWIVIAVIVALHFVGMARWTSFRYFYGVAGAMVGVAAIALAVDMITSRDDLALVVVGLGCYAVLLGSGVRAGLIVRAA